MVRLPNYVDGPLLDCRAVVRLPSGRYRAQARVAGRYCSLGHFATWREALEASMDFQRRRYGRRSLEVARESGGSGPDRPKAYPRSGSS